MYIKKTSKDIRFQFTSQEFKTRKDKVMDFLALLKDEVPKEQRSYNPENRVWKVNIAYERIFNQILNAVLAPERFKITRV